MKMFEELQTQANSIQKTIKWIAKMNKEQQEEYKLNKKTNLYKGISHGSEDDDECKYYMFLKFISKGLDDYKLLEGKLIEPINLD